MIGKLGTSNLMNCEQNIHTPVYYHDGPLGASEFESRYKLGTSWELGNVAKLSFPYTTSVESKSVMSVVGYSYVR